VDNPVDAWGMTAALLAVILELLACLAIWRFDRKHRSPAGVTARSNARDNAALIIFSTAFLALTVSSGIQGDYGSYLVEWRAVLTTHEPWQMRVQPFNSYGPLFNVLAIPPLINPLANKLLCAFGYIAFLIWLIKDFAPRRGFDVLSSWPWMLFWFLNPFPWEQIAYNGYFDILIALACVAAVHCLIGRKEGLSGAWLAASVLVKYFPVVVLPFLAVDQRRVHFRLVAAFAGVVVLGMTVSVAIWGTSTFAPLTLAATRRPFWSIYNVLATPHLPFQTLMDPSNVGWIERPLLLAAGLGTFAWSYVRRLDLVQSSVLAVLVTLLFYRVGYPNYLMVVLSLISYWWVSNWSDLKTRSALSILVFGYFCLLSFEDLAFWWHLQSVLHDYRFTVFCQFLAGFVVLISLASLRPASAAEQQILREEGE
jgi:hypothetical protein